VVYRFNSATTNYDLVLSAGFDQSVNPQAIWDFVSTTDTVNGDIGQWQLYVIEYNIAGIFYVWRNGIALGLSNGGQLTSAYTGAAGVIALGAAGGTLSNYFVGSLDEMRFWYGVNLPLVDVLALYCNNVVNSVPSFYMNGADFLSFGTAQTTSSPAPALTGQDVTNECYGYCGASNSTNSSACASSPCANGGICFAPTSDTFSCSCPAGFSGTTCATAINPCLATSCQNGGTCHAGSGSSSGTFTCTCAPGFTGLRCAASGSGGPSSMSSSTGTAQGTGSSAANVRASLGTVALLVVAGVYAIVAFH